MTAPVSLTPERVNELIEILDEQSTQLQPRDCSHLIHALIELRSLRTELLAARREWQPIETAPKNREFLACSKTLRPFIAHWGNPLGWLDSVGLQRDPTHWRHLPPPPETAV